MRGCLTALLLCLSSAFLHLTAQHNNEFYVRGAHVTIESYATLHVQGDVHLDEGTSSEKGGFHILGILELRQCTEWAGCDQSMEGLVGGNECTPGAFVWMGDRRCHLTV